MDLVVVFGACYWLLCTKSDDDGEGGQNNAGNQRTNARGNINRAMKDLSEVVNEGEDHQQDIECGGDNFSGLEDVAIEQPEMPPQPEFDSSGMMDFF